MVNRLIIIISVFLLIAISYSSEYTMSVKLKNGTMHNYNVAQITKIKFDLTVNIDDSRKYVGVLKMFNLLQNYPNPFNPKTTIEYDLPKAGEIEINIFNNIGQHVKTFKKKHLSGGLQSIVWDGRSDTGVKVATGMYFYQARFEKQMLSRKMLILK